MHRLRNRAGLLPSLIVLFLSVACAGLPSVANLDDSLNASGFGALRSEPRTIVPAAANAESKAAVSVASPAPLSESLLSAEPLANNGKTDRAIVSVACLEPSPEKSLPSPAHSPGTACNDRCYGHSADYTRLTGELQYVEVRAVWRLRFASTEDEDRYGGSVSLLDIDGAESLKNGQKVLVEGRLVDPITSDPSPAYQVRRIQKIRRP
jgi:hypothetical protein